MREKIIYKYINMNNYANFVEDIKNNTSHDYNNFINEIIYRTKDIFSQYLDPGFLDISIKCIEECDLTIPFHERKSHFNIAIDIFLKNTNFIEKLKKLKKEEKYQTVNDENISNIVENINHFNPALRGFINFEREEHYLANVKVGLFLNNDTRTFTLNEQKFALKLLRGMGLGSLLILVYQYICYCFKVKYYDDKEDSNIMLNDTSNFDKIYENLNFVMDAGDGEFKLSKENFNNLIENIKKYGKKSKKSELNFFTQQEYSDNVNTNNKRPRGGRTRKKKYIKKNNKKTKSNKKITKKNNRDKFNKKTKKSKTN
jgi:hypothetical protein